MMSLYGEFSTREAWLPFDLAGLEAMLEPSTADVLFRVPGD